MPSHKETKSCKRAASTSLKCHTSAKKKSCPSGPAAVSNNSANDGGLKTPQHRTNAICAVRNDQELDASECIKAIHLFKCDIAAADAYLAIDESDIHAEFICLEIEEI